jgi:hypothetical protein
MQNVEGVVCDPARTALRATYPTSCRQEQRLILRTCRRPGRGRGVAGWVVRCADRVADREGRGTDRRYRYDRLSCQAGKDPFGPLAGPIRTMK